MEPKITTIGEFRVLGVQTIIDPRTADYQALWGKDFTPYHETIKALAAGPEYYGVYFPTSEPNKVAFVAGMAVAALHQTPAGLTVRTIEKMLCAIFECQMATIGQTWGYIYGGWLATSREYAEAPGKPCFEYFPVNESCEPTNVLIHVPIIAI